MTTASPPKSNNGKHHFDPDQYRMTIGEHLEELRTRLIYSIVGFFLAFFVCFYFSDDTIAYFCKPLTETLKQYDVNPQLNAADVTEGFMVALRISMITAAALAGPWMLYQLWQFVAAGLYPQERKYITKYLPLSITLLVGGMAFVYFLVLPWTLDFFIGYIMKMPPPDATTPAAEVAPVTPGTPPATAPAAEFLIVTEYYGIPDPLKPGMLWFDTRDQQLKIYQRGKINVLAVRNNNLLTPEIELGNYITLVVAMLVAVGVAFQLPLVVLAVEKIGIVEVEGLRAARKYVYFAIVVAAAVISPGDAVTVTVALVGPLIILYELGIWLAAIGNKGEGAGAARA